MNETQKDQYLLPECGDLEITLSRSLLDHSGDVVDLVEREETWL